MKSSPQGIKEESIVNLLVNEAIKTSEIEGEFISRIDLISSIRKNLAIAKTSKATATRDLTDLVEKGILTAKGGSRSVGYQVGL